ncbi:hypothetical protein [Paraburkholderia humisilvae]|uniref:EF-hand domain-containing protein n=1 Tax=Paraburkholderia humisilvae TaxID=627669 RepID=A0A6J5F559_9BURK|nr:hypothetical protein [Paraburkholderia humisilvae]CAB3773614.1 hypothetical protein LMG29542_07345 [Paraburkholderia humisilvae]
MTIPSSTIPQRPSVSAPAQPVANEPVATRTARSGMATGGSAELRNLPPRAPSPGAAASSGSVIRSRGALPVPEQTTRGEPEIKEIPRDAPPAKPENVLTQPTAAVVQNAGRAIPRFTVSEIASWLHLNTKDEPHLDLYDLQKRLDRNQTRPINTRELARLVNEARPSLLYERKDGHIPRTEELVKEISEGQVENWHRALGVSRDEVKKMELAAKRSGWFIPMSSTIFNLFNYVGVPLWTKGSSSPWDPATASITVSTVQPFATAPSQSFFIGIIDYLRRYNLTEVPLDKTHVNSKRTHPEIKDHIGQAATSMSKHREAVMSLFRKHGLVDGDGTIDDNELVTKLSAINSSSEDSKALVDACRQYMDETLNLCIGVDELRGLDAAHARQIESQKDQVVSRMLRSASSIGAPFFREPNPQVAHSPISDIFAIKIPSDKVLYLSMGIAMFAIAMQHRAAGSDEVNGMKLEHKLNVLMADIYKNPVDGYIKRPITEADISEEKCRNLVVPAEVTVVRRVAERLKAAQDKLEAKRDAELNKAKSAARADGSLHAMERGETRQLTEQIAELESERQKLGKLQVTDLREETKALLQYAFNRPWSFALGDGLAKTMKPGEFSSQTIQRAGQALTGVVAGGAMAAVGGRIITAKLGGTNEVSHTVQFILALMSGMVGLVAALTQGMVTNIKNERRESKDPHSVKSGIEQFAKGVGLPVVLTYNAVARRKALNDAESALREFDQLHASLERVFRELDNAVLEDEAEALLDEPEAEVAPQAHGAKAGASTQTALSANMAEDRSASKPA